MNGLNTLAIQLVSLLRALTIISMVTAGSLSLVACNWSESGSSSSSSEADQEPGEDNDSVEGGEDTGANASLYVESVDGVANQLAEWGVLNRGLDGTAGITLTLSETIKSDDLHSGSVLVYSYSLKEYLVPDTDYELVNLPDNGKSLTIRLISPLDAGERVSIRLWVHDVISANDGNVLGLGDSIGFAEIIQLNGMDYISLNLQAFQDALPVSGIEDGSFEQLDTDPEGLEFVHLESYQALKDSNRYGGVIYQLNGERGKAEQVAERLSALAKGITATGNDIAPREVLANVARLTFKPTQPGEYQIELLDEAGNNQPVKLITDVQMDNKIATRDIENNNSDLVKVTVTKSEKHFMLDEIEVGWTVKLRLGDTGKWAEVILEDHVPPMPILQRSYGYCDYGHGSDNINGFGEGGELAKENSNNPATNGKIYPRLCVTPMLFAPYTGVSPTKVEKERALEVLYSGREHGITPDGDKEIHPLGGADMPYYDKQAHDSWDSEQKSYQRTVGVAMSESVKLKKDPEYDGTTENIINYRANNNVLVDDRGNEVHADLIIFDVMNIMKLAADDGAEMQFKSVLSDRFDNDADEHAKVVITDRMPPLVTDVVYELDSNDNDRRILTVSFNEPVKMAKGDSLVFEKFSVIAESDKDSTDDAKGGDTAVNNRTLIFTKDEIAGGIAPVFTTKENKTFQAVNGSNRKVVMDFTQVQDAHGNRWKDYKEEGEHFQPKFLVKAPDAFNAWVADTTDFKAGEGKFTVEFRANYPINFEEMPGNVENISNWDGSESLSGVDLESLGFDLTDSKIDFESVDTKATLDKDGSEYVLSVTFDLQGLLAKDDALEIPDFFADTTQFLPESEPVNPGTGLNGDKEPPVVK